MSNVGSLVIQIKADYGEFSRDLQTVERQMNGFAGRTQSSMQQLGQTLTRTLTPAILAIGAAATTAAVRWESDFAGVEKTVEASREVLDQLNDELRNLATNSNAPVAGLRDAHHELAKIAELGGQLGVPVEMISEFTDVVGQLTIATNLTGEEAATMLAQYANITGLDFKNFRNLGNVIVELGNNMATTEKDIVEFMQRLAASGSMIGFSDDEIAALAATTASLGLNAEATGSAFARVALDIDKFVGQGGAQLRLLADTAGLSAQEFADAWTDDPSTAFLNFLRGLSGQGPAEALGTLEGLGFQAIRVRELLFRLSSNTDLLSQAFGMASGEFGRFGDALGVEAQKRFETTAAQINLLINNLYNLGITVGNVVLPVILSLVNALVPLISSLANASPELATLLVVLGGIAAAAGPVLAWGSRFVGILGAIVSNPIVIGIVAIGAALKGLYAVLDSTGKLWQFEHNLDVLRTMFDRVGAAVGSIFGVLGRLGSLFLTTLFPGITRTGDAINDFSVWINDALISVNAFFRPMSNFAVAVKEVADGFISFFDVFSGRETITTFSAQMQNLVNNPIMRLLFGETRLDEQGFAVIYNFFAQLYENVQKAATALRDFNFGAVLSGIAASIENSPLGKAISNIFGSVSTTVKANPVVLQLQGILLEARDKIEGSEFAAKFTEIRDAFGVGINQAFDRFTINTKNVGLIGSIPILIDDIKRSIQFALLYADVSDLRGAFMTMLSNIFSGGGTGVSGPIEQGDAGFETGNIFTNIIDGIKERFSGLGEAIKSGDWSGVQQSVADNIGEIIAGAFGLLRVLAGGPISIATTIAGFIINLIKQSNPEIISEIESKITDAFAPVTEALNTAIGNALGKPASETGVGKEGEKGGILAFIENIFNQLSTLIGDNQGTINTLQNVFTGVAGTIVSFFTTLNPFVGSLVISLIERLPGLMKSVGDAIGNLSKGDYSGIVKVIGFIAGVLGAITDAIAAGIETAIPILADMFASLNSWLSDMLKGDIRAAGEDAKAFFTSLGDGIGAVLTAIGSSGAQALFDFLGMGRNVQDDLAAWSDVGSNLATIFSQLSTIITNTLNKAALDLETAVASFIANVSQTLANLGLMSVDEATKNKLVAQGYEETRAILDSIVNHPQDPLPPITVPLNYIQFDNLDPNAIQAALDSAIQDMDVARIQSILPIAEWLGLDTQGVLASISNSFDAGTATTAILDSLSAAFTEMGGSEGDIARMNEIMAPIINSMFNAIVNGVQDNSAENAIKVIEAIRTSLETNLGETGVELFNAVMLTMGVDINNPEEIANMTADQLREIIEMFTYPTYNVVITADILMNAGNIDITNMNAAVQAAINNLSGGVHRTGDNTIRVGPAGGGYQNFIPGAQTGADILRDGLINVHRGERVLTPASVTRTRHEESGGGDIIIQNFGGNVYEVLDVVERARRDKGL